jgi:hypothetical protein
VTVGSADFCGTWTNRSSPVTSRSGAVLTRLTLALGGIYDFVRAL